MGNNPNPARMNQTGTQVLLRTEPNPKVKDVQEPEPNWTLPHEAPNTTRTHMSLFSLGFPWMKL